MDLKRLVQDRAMKLMQDPRVMKLMQDPRVMKALMQAVQARGKVQETLDEQAERIAKTLNFATKSEVRELKRMLKKMEAELDRERKKAAEGEKAEKARAAKSG